MGHGISVIERLKPNRPEGRTLDIPLTVLRTFKKAVKEAYVEGYIQREVEAGPSKAGLDADKAWKESEAKREIDAAKVIEEKRSDFPLYLIRIGESRKFLPIAETGIAYDSGFVKVEICGDVLEANGSIRQITLKEKNRISEIADRHSESK